MDAGWQVSPRSEGSGRAAHSGGGEDRSAGAFTEHHAAHAASAFYPSPFDSAAVLTLDGVGVWATTTIGRGDGDRVRILEEIRYPHSLGCFTVP
jgi:carbamoyltransferase